MGTICSVVLLFFFQAEDGIRVRNVTGVQTCALPISSASRVRAMLSAANHQIGRLHSRGRDTSRVDPATAGSSAVTTKIGRASCRERGKDKRVGVLSRKDTKLKLKDTCKYVDV